MKFSEYFNEWLYAEEGYYTTFKAIGKEGDFYTAVSTSKFFGGAIAKHIIRVIDEGFLSPQCTILEIGAHKGYLLADIIEFINTLRPQLLDTLHFAIVEKYEQLRFIQQKYFQECFGDALKLHHFCALDEIALDEAFVISNEIFDAFSCELVLTKDEVLMQANVFNHKITWNEADDALQHICAKYAIRKGEVIVGVASFASLLAKAIKKIEFVSFDYGELFARNDFSLRIYQSHKVYPFFEEAVDRQSLFQKSDITFDVNFSQIIDDFCEQGFRLVAYDTQLKALVEMGILDLLQMVLDNAGQNAYLRELNKVKTLINPTSMGERFKMVRLRKE